MELSKYHVPLRREELSNGFTHRREIQTGEPDKDVVADKIQIGIDAKFNLLGLPEDIGIRANHGRAGSAEAYSSFLKSMSGLPMKNSGIWQNLSLWGEVNFADLMTKAENLKAESLDQRRQLSKLVEEIDNRVEETATHLFKLTGIPIFLGGGHNNALPIIRAAAAIYGPIDVINVDAHTDLRPPTGRHSGNGFSHALGEGVLNRYTVMGLQEMYLTADMEQLMKQYNVGYIPREMLQEHLHHIQLTDYVSGNYGLELDMDVVADFPSSAKNPLGISLEQLIALTQRLTHQQKPAYIHICEVAPKYGYPSQAAKALCHLIYALIA